MSLVLGLFEVQMLALATAMIIGRREAAQRR